MLKDELRVRRMQLTDVERVHALETGSFFSPWSVKSIASEIEANERAVPFVVEKDGQVVGYALYRVCEHEAEVGSLAVAPEWRRRGVGDFLLRQTLEALQSREIEVVHLEVRGSNQAAKKLYEKHGFAVAGLRKNYYFKENEDAILMSLSLTEG